MGIWEDGTPMSEVTKGREVERTGPAVTRRREIAQRAAELFDAAGYYSTSMEDIAESAGLRKPTLYHYFKSKDEILLEIHSEMIELILRRHEERLAAGVESHSQELRGLMGDLIELMETHPGHLRIFFEHQRELPEDYQAPIRRKRNRFRDELAALLERGVVSGEFRKSLDVEMTTLAILGMANWTYTWLYPEGSRGAAEVADHFWHLTMRAIAAPGAVDSVFQVT